MGGYNDQEPLQGMTFRVMRAELMNCDVNYEDSPEEEEYCLHNLQNTAGVCWAEQKSRGTSAVRH